MTPITIVRAEHAHLKVLAPLFDAYRVFYEQPSDPKAAYTYLHMRLSRQESVVFLALDGEQGVGFTQLYPGFGSVSLQHYWLLYDLYVAPDARRRGVGRALLERAHEFARETSAGWVELATAVDNHQAQALYESLGYKRDNEFYHYELSL